MNTLSRIWIKPATGILGLALFFTCANGSKAQQSNPNARAARLSYVQGDVQIAQGGQILADPALVNTPLFEGTLITTKEDGRAEVQFDDGTLARVSPNSSVKLVVLGQQGGVGHAEMKLESGLAYIEMPGDTSTDRSVARFGDSSVTASGYTVVRIDMDNPPGEMAVFTGNAHLERGNSLSLDLHGGQSVALNAGDSGQYNLAETIEPNSWDAWNADRDQELTTEQSAKTAASGSQPNSNNPAWGDLDANGNWYNVPGEGYVWSPYEASSEDWDPYGYGNWVWNPSYGYSWVSGYPWGYLPYTCGYWNYYNGFGWGWTPGYGYPWWATGGWVINIGHRPHQYDPPHRPHGGPVHPPIHRGGSYQPNPVIAVNRIPRSPQANPVHVVGRPVTIAGSTVSPMQPLSPRPVYNPTAPGAGRTFQGGMNPGLIRPGAPSNSVPGHSGYVPWANSPGSHAGTWSIPSSPGNINRSPAGPPSVYRGPATPPSIYRMPSAPPSVYRAPAPAPSHSGYSGGAPRVSPSPGGGHVSAPAGGGHVSAPSGHR